MGEYIVLCDHNTKWAGKFKDEAGKRNIETFVIENIADEEQRLIDNGGHEVLVCSLAELKEYLKSDKRKIEDSGMFFEKVNVFIISDSNADKEEIKYISKGCIDYQWRKRNIFVILERVAAILEKMEKEEIMLVDTKEFFMLYKDEKIKLNKHEADFFRILFKTAGIISAEYICQKIWKKKDDKTKSALYSIIYRLRKKMPDNGACIHNIYGKGFVLSKDAIRMIR